MPQVTELTPDQLRRVCDPAMFAFQSTSDLPVLEDIVGQERALRAIAFGIDIRTPGYHMYALGPNGTGKTTTVRKFLEQEAVNRPVPDDWLYFNNFTDPDRPRALRLPPGVGCKLRDDMDKLVEELRRDVPRSFESQEYQKQQEELGSEFEKRRDAIFAEAEQEAQARGLALLPTPQGLMIAPIVNGKVLSPEQLQHISEDKRKEVEDAQNAIQGKLRDTMRQMQQLQREARERGNEADRNMVAFAVGHWLDELRERYAEYPPVVKLLDEIREDILKNVQTFKQIRQLEQMQNEQAPLAAMLGREAPSFDQYKVNLIVNNCDTKGAPVILARNPNYNNVIGRIEHTGQFGMLVTNFNMIKGGLLHKANGGYLMIDVYDLLTKPLAWEGLKRALKNKTVEIETMAEAYGAFATHTLTPEPIPLDIKVILVGDPYIYYLMYALDPDFQQLFRVKADFTSRMERTAESAEQYARFISTVVKEENLRHFDPTGVAKVVEHGSRMVEDQRKLATKFGDVVNLIRESSYWAGKNNHELVTGGDVTQAIKEKIYRSNLIEDLLQEMIVDGTIMIDTENAVPGQINGLAVLSLGDYAFGKPSRITARTYVGDAGVINIEREVKMGGKIHNKGAMILSGYLGGKYATNVPLALSATLTFEQVYEEIEGDSASSTELYALISSLADIPIRQDFAVTGSVNQYGQIQAIGGVNEKVEGYFDVCKARGLTGSQGVLIPHTNAKHLMLREDVVDAVRQGQFHVYPIATIDEGISLLTGREAGERRIDGSYPDGTINGAVQRRLSDLAQKVKAFVSPKEKRGEDEEGRKAA